MKAAAGTLSPLLLLLPVGLLCYGLGSFGLLNNVEGLYAEISREMLASHDWHGWIIPHLNGLAYIEKPPLLYWAQALAMALFGVSDWAARLVPVLASLASMASLWWYGRRRHDEGFGRMAAFMLGTSLGFFSLCKIGMTDPLLSACFNAALLTSHLAWVEGRPALLRWALVWLALAVLTKGLVALALFGGVWVVYGALCARGEWRRLARFVLAADAWGIFLAVAAPWHVAAALSLDGFAWFYFVNEHVLRFLGLREPHDYYSGSPFYYLPRLMLMAFPWCLVLLAGAIARWRGPRAAAPGEDFLWIALVVPLAFFSLSAAKANYYVLICLPALALLAAAELRCARGGVLAFLNARFTPLALVLALILGPLLAYGLAAAEREENRFSARALADEILRRDGEIPVYLYQDYEDESSLAFYLGKGNLRVIDERSQDLAFALGRQHDAQDYPRLGEFLAHPERAWVVVLDARVRDGMPPQLAAVLGSPRRFGNAVLYLRQS